MLRRIKEYVSTYDYHRDDVRLFNAYLSSDDSTMAEVLEMPGRQYMTTFLVTLNWYRDSISGYVIIKYEPDLIKSPELITVIGTSYFCKICRMKNWPLNQNIWFYAIKQFRNLQMENIRSSSSITLFIVGDWLCYLIYSNSKSYPIEVIDTIRSKSNNIILTEKKKNFLIFLSILCSSLIKYINIL